MQIYGIHSELKTFKARQAARKVLKQIKKRSLKDFTRLQSLIKNIVPYSENNGTMGEWKEEPLNPSDPKIWLPGFDEFARAGIVEIYEQATQAQLIATLAHEFGHACTTSDDLSRRKSPSDEWDSELSADWYAYKWGFARFIARHRKDREWLHHLVGPGHWFEYNGTRYLISRNFVCKRI